MKTGATPAADRPNLAAAIATRMATILLVLALQAAILFGAAGTADGLMGWIYLGLFIFLSLGSRVLVRRKNPEWIAERAGSLDRADVSRTDKALVGLIDKFGDKYREY